MIEETHEGPKWLKELEEKREKRVKARLGHEAGAGSPCLTCEDKCPGLDLHFWRKICKNCKCGKESHDVNDDDIYGWAQFQLLGSKPNKAKKIVLPGRKDVVELEWAPKGLTDEVVESYLKDLPVNLLPIKGSAAAQERKQLLQKQIPLHDIDPTLCHALSESEVKQMNDYLDHVKQHSVGMGHIMKLNELLKKRHGVNAQILSSRAPMQIPQMQNIVLQGVDRANSLKMERQGGGDLHKGLRDLSLDKQKGYVTQEDQDAANVHNVRDIFYDTYTQDEGKNVNANLSGSLESQIPSELGQTKQSNIKNIQIPLHNLKNIQMPQQPNAHQIDYQNSTNIGDVRDIKYPYNIQNISNHPVSIKNEYENVRYPSANQTVGQIPNEPIYTELDFQNPSNLAGIRDVYYPGNENQHMKYRDGSIPANFAQMHPKNIQNLPRNTNSPLTNFESTQNPVGYDIRNIYPDMNVNYEPHIHIGDTETVSEQLDNLANLKGDAKMPHYVPGRFNTFVEQQNPRTIGNIKDLAYSTYDPSTNLDLSNENLHNYHENPNSAFNPESNLNPLLNAGKGINSNFKPSNVSSIMEKNSKSTLNPSNTLSNTKNNFDPTYQSSDPYFNPSDSQFNSADDHFNPSDPHYNNSSDPANPHVNPSNPKFNPLNPNFNRSNPPVNSSDPHFNPSNPNFHPSNPNFNPSNPHLNSSDPHFDPSNPHFNPSNPHFNPSDPHFSASNPHLKPSDPLFNPSDHHFHPENNYSPSRTSSKYENNANPSSMPQRNFNPGSNLLRPANYNPNEINVSEQSLNPTSVNVGIINDIEYPTIKSAVQRQNDIFEPELPRKNVQFDLNPQEILPSCHKCKKMFDSSALVIGVDRTDSLWHAECFKCTGCNQNLADLMYFYHKESDDIYCGRDYAKIRGIPRCQACDELIFVKEYCLAENSTFHVKHFCCFECDEPLAGQNYVMEDSQPLCLPCFENIKAEKCNTCLKVIKPDEQGANLNGVHFHADSNCFSCKMCKKPLLGAKLLFKNQNLYCSAPCFGADK